MCYPHALHYDFCVTFVSALLFALCGLFVFYCCDMQTPPWRLINRSTGSKQLNIYNSMTVRIPYADEDHVI